MSEYNSENFESVPIQDEEVIDALKTERKDSLELLKTWYEQQQIAADEANTSQANVELAVHLGEIYYKANLTIEAEEAFADALGAAELEEDEEFLNEIASRIENIRLGN